MLKRQAIKYLQQTELDVQNAHAAFFALDLVYRAYVESYHLHKVRFNTVFCYVFYNKPTSFFQFVSRKKIEALGKRMYEDYVKNQKSLQKRINEHRKCAKLLDKIWKQYAKKRNEALTRKEILEIYRKMVDASIKWWQYAVIGEDKGHVIELEVVPNFEKRHQLSKAKARQLVFGLAHPNEQSIFNIERADFLSICLHILNHPRLKNAICAENHSYLLEDKELRNRIRSYLRKHFWVKSTFYKAVTITAKSILQEAKNEIASRKKGELVRELSSIRQSFAEIQKKKKKLLRSVRLTKEDKKDIRFAELITYWVDQRKLWMMHFFHYMLSFLEDISKRFGIKYHELTLSTVEEVADFIKSGKRIGKKTMRSRDRGVMQIFEKGKVTRFYGKEAKEMFEIATAAKSATILRGITASAGKTAKIKGVVKIVHNPSRDFFTQGQILVTSMTRVEFVPLMRKAKAVITNEGGVACHAAIVSRELGIPCIIGTKTATMVLKDNDLVEVDTNNGTVRVVKKR
jgi:phosphohistidine swiveling domain-containing protein